MCACTIDSAVAGDIAVCRKQGIFYGMIWNVYDNIGRKTVTVIMHGIRRVIRMRGISAGQAGIIDVGIIDIGIIDVSIIAIRIIDICTADICIAGVCLFRIFGVFRIIFSTSVFLCVLDIVRNRGDPSGLDVDARFCIESV
ncbi:hypothetical protein IMSAGC020_02511 [Lachnospiraceae bacterium]|nr:hypothetical protein IMSAGC020_02511 [Lachnospiraceae bacterium]